MSKEIELFYYQFMDQTYVTTALPVPDGSGGLRAADGAASIAVCDKGRAVFGVPLVKKGGQIVRVALDVKSVEVGGYEIVTEFKPFAPERPARRRS